MKRSVSILLLLSLLLVTAPLSAGAVPTGSGISLYPDGVRLKSPIEPRIEEQTTLVTAQISGTNYARLYFVIGLENPDWKKNESFAKQLEAGLKRNIRGCQEASIIRKTAPGTAGITRTCLPAVP